MHPRQRNYFNRTPGGRDRAGLVCEFSLSVAGTTLVGMPPTPPGLGPARPAAVVNEEIRGLWLRAGGTLSAAERREYELLLIEWAAAVRAKVVEAA